MAARSQKKPESCGSEGGGVRRIVMVHAGSAPGVNTSIPFVLHDAATATTFKVGTSASALRVTVSLATGSVFNLVVTDGSTAYTQHFNGGTALTAGCLYAFTIGCARFKDNNTDTELTYAFQVATDSVIQTLIVDEVAGVSL